jgi:hypothetical protein
MLAQGQKVPLIIREEGQDGVHIFVAEMFNSFEEGR